MNQIFRAPSCGKLHTIDDGMPVAHKCDVHFPEVDLVGNESVARAENPVEPGRIQSRHEPDDVVPAPRAFAQEQQNPAYYRRKMNPVDVVEVGEEVDESPISSMAAAKERFQEDRPQLHYAPNPTPACPVAQPSARPARANNPLPRSLDECEVKSPGGRRENPVTTTTDDKQTRRCEILKVRHNNKFPGEEISCEELERAEGPAFDALLARGLVALSPEKRAEMVEKNPDYARILKDQPSPAAKQYASNPVATETMEKAKSAIGTAPVEPPLAQPKSVAVQPQSVPAKGKVAAARKEAQKEPPPAAAPSKNTAWRERRVPLPQAMQFVLNSLQVSSKSYPSLARLRTERARKVSLSMIDFALRDLEKFVPSLQGESLQNAKAVQNDLQLVRMSWRERATVVVDGTDDQSYPINESKIKI